MFLNFGVIASFLITFQYLFVSLFLFTHHKGNKRNNILLGLLFLFFSLSFADFSIRAYGIILPFPILHLIDDGFFFLYGPILYFYTKGVVFENFKLKVSHSIHLTPYVLSLILLCYQFLSINRKSQFELADKIVTVEVPIWVFVLSLLIYIHIFFYLWKAWNVIKIYRTAIKTQFSNIDTINLNWLKFMIKAFISITIVAMINNLIPVLNNEIVYFFSITLLLITSFIFINRVLIKALNQPKVFSGIEIAEKYIGSNLKIEDSQNYKRELIRLMEKEKVYLNPELTSKQLSALINVSQKTLSQVINQNFNQNFFDFINTYRCKEVKSLLDTEGDKFTILEAMYQAGFNSKSSFNKEFKKLTGQTPSAYRRSLKD